MNSVGKPLASGVDATLYLSDAIVACYENDNQAYIPEQWAREGLEILLENMVAARLVHRDFSPAVAKFGETVHTRRPSEFKIRRKTDSDVLQHQDAISTDVQVKLDQWFYNAFTIKDGEGSKSFQDLVDVYLKPAMQNIARAVDRTVLGQVHQFFGTPAARAGRLGALSGTNSKDFVLDARERLNVNKAPQDGRRLILAPASETALLKTEMFIKANERGDGGSALENAVLGRILGFDTYLDQNVNSILTGAETASGTVTNALAAGGSGSQAVTITGYEVNLGEFATVAGNDQPAFITAATVSTDTTAVTMNEANKYATGAGAVITVFKAADVNGDYAVGYSKGIIIDGWAASTAPQVGQLIAFGTAGNRRTYTVIESELTAVGEQTIYLDRPLEVALANSDLAFPGPYGSMNWAFHRNALALVTRPLALPDSAMGVRAGVADMDGVGMRVVMQYDIDTGGTKVNLDILAGVKVLDTRLCVPLLG